MSSDPVLEVARARRWWLTKPKIARITRAAAFVEDVGFAVLFPKRGVPMPSLWVAASARMRDDDADGFDWDEDAERIWAWKDELPLRGLAWYGPFIRSRKSFVSPALLADLYPRAGAADDYRLTALSPDARRVADIILASGPTSAAALREATSLIGTKGNAAFTRAITELGRALVVTHFGVEEQGAGWPSSVFELTARAFDVRPTNDRVDAARTFLRTMIETRAVDLARAFNWDAPSAREALGELIARGEAARDGATFRPRVQSGSASGARVSPGSSGTSPPAIT